MYFNHPVFLYGLLAVLIPIIIHLFNFRRYKKLYFSNIAFLKNITTQTRKQNKLKQIIVLILRILAIVAIVLAFAEPVFKKKENVLLTPNALTAVYVDNSFSMMAEGENGRLFEEAVSNAHELVSRSARDTRFVLLSNDISHDQRRVLTKEAMLNEIEHLEISPSSRNINSIAATAATIASEKDYVTYEMYLFSDFQKNSIDIATIAKDTAAYLYMLPMVHLQKRNIYIDTCWLSDPVLIANHKITLNVRLRNSSVLDYEKIPLKLMINGQQKAVAGVDIVAGGFEVVTMNFTARQAGWHYASLEIEDFPITFDDQFYFAFHVKKQVNVLEIADEAATGDLSIFYGSDSLFHYTKMDYRRVKYDEIYNYNLIILNSLPSISSGLTGQLQKFTEAGGNLMFIPNEDVDVKEENSLLAAFGAGSIQKFDPRESRVSGIKNETLLFRESIHKVPDNADLPVVFSHFQYRYHINSGVESLVSLLNGDDFLATKKTGNGRLYMLAVPLKKTFSNFASHPLFVPVMYGAAVEGDAHAALFHTIGKDEKISLNQLDKVPEMDQTFSIKKYENEYIFIPEQQIMNNGLMLDMHEGIETDGFYELTWDEKPEYVFAFNYDRAESQLDFYTEDELREQIESEELNRIQVLSAGHTGYLEMLNTVENESQLWKLFIIFALLMLLAETLVLRFWK
ncbi:MAG: BatA domain-containing protein [Bacteroidetes bacterium]|nr:BatA domain-containing protein [Bacteroidota bacterium]